MKQKIKPFTLFSRPPLHEYWLLVHKINIDTPPNPTVSWCNHLIQWGGWYGNPGCCHDEPMHVVDVDELNLRNRQKRKIYIVHLPCAVDTNSSLREVITWELVISPHWYKKISAIVLSSLYSLRYFTFSINPNKAK